MNLLLKPKNPPSKPALIDQTYRHLEAINAFLYDLYKGPERETLGLYLVPLIDKTEALIERVEEIIAEREAELGEW